MPRPVHFEIHAADPERARNFYQQLFGWTFEQWGDQDYWMVTTGDGTAPGINGGLVQRRGPRPEPGAAVNAFPVTVDVPDVRVYLARAMEAGGQVAVDTVAVPGVGWLAYVIDSEGNLVGLMQSDPSAG